MQYERARAGLNWPMAERQFERVGGTQSILSDFRVIAATNRELEEEVKNGRFREDLFYRLNVIPIKAPPLRERQSDIPLLVEYFIQKLNRTKKRNITGLTSEALNSLVRYTWPGNVRELENIVERMVILAAGSELTEEDLSQKIRSSKADSGGCVNEIPASGFILSDVVADYEKKLIVQALNQTDWVKNQAAMLLNINRTTLIEKMKRHKLVKPAVELVAH